MDAVKKKKKSWCERSFQWANDFQALLFLLKEGATQLLED